MTTRGGWSPAVMSWVASMPSMPGMRMSMTTTSGRVSLATWMAWAPVAASPVTSMPGVLSMSTRRPVRTRGWSSASTTRTVIGLLRGPAGGLERQPGRYPEAAPGLRAGGELAAQQGCPFAHACDAVPGACAAGDAGAVPVVGDLDGEGFFLVADRYLAVGRAGYLGQWLIEKRTEPFGALVIVTV